MIKDSSDLEEVIIFSDTHISKYTGLFHKKAFNIGVKLINTRLKANPDSLLLHLGDITDSGTYEDFLFSKKILDKSFPDINYFSIPGNHDMRNIGDQLWSDFFDERQFLIDTTKEGGNMIILGIDSSEPDKNIGRIGDRGIEAISELQSYPDDIIKILCFHHHLLPIPNTGRERSMILDAGDVMRAIWDGGVDVIITAHRHYPNLFSLSNGERRCLLVNCGTFSSFKTRGKAGHTFVDLVLNTNKVSIKFYGAEEYSQFRKPVKESHTIMKGEFRTNIGYVLPGDKIISKICQFSDTHFTTGGDFLPEVYDLGIKMMIREEPDVLIHCGDLTNDSYPEDFAIAKMKLRELQTHKIPILIVPGIRDLQPFGRELWVQQVGPLDPIHEDQNLRILGINTGNEASGHVGRSRMKMIKHEFENYGSYKFFLAVMHHSVLPIPRAHFTRAVTDAGDVIDFVTKRQVPLVLSGLDHFSTSMQIEDTLFVNAGTFSSKKIRSKKLNTFNSLSIFESGVVKVEEIEIHSGVRHVLGLYKVPIVPLG
ncbi:MAG: metallophosphoesterase family protein [Candidatus Hodarchaeales archaeon]